MAKIKTRWTRVEVADGTTMRCFIARPAAPGKAPALLVLQEAFGVNDHIRSVAKRFAAKGFFAVAPELYHRTGEGFEGAYDNFDAIRPHMQAVTVETMTADLKAVYEALKEESAVDVKRVGAIGYCMGGRVAYVANAVLPLGAAVSYYGARIAPDLLDLAGEQHAPIMFFWGGKDKHIDASQRAAVVSALNARGKDYINVEISFADHGFFTDDRASYNPEAAALSWKLALPFLKRHLMPSTARPWAGAKAGRAPARKSRD